MLKEHERQYVVGTNTGGFPLPSNFERTFKLFLKKANITDKGVLSTRHTYATKLIRTKKVPLRVISKGLCDRSEKVTRDIYPYLPWRIGRFIRGCWGHVRDSRNRPIGCTERGCNLRVSASYIISIFIVIFIIIEL